MCGITGFINRIENTRYDSNIILKDMNNTLMYRGPDHDGYWTDSRQGVYLGHRRLSVIDVSDTGNQPMISKSGRYVLTYNGEVYNFIDIKSRLQSEIGLNWTGSSDTEVILAAIELLGVDKAIKLLNGMFSFALWDTVKKELFLVRDRMGKKPLYWGCFGNIFIFGSELKALRAHPAWQPEINRDALTSYMRYSYIPTPYTIYKRIYKLPPGTILTFQKNKEPVIKHYWNMASIAQDGLNDPLVLNDCEAIGQTEELINDAVKSRMVADVPLGALLSGGYDSSMVVAMMQANSIFPVKTFSIGFNESGYDEAHHAKLVAKYLGTDHTELYTSPEEARNVIPMLADIYDEPFADSSQIPSYLVSKLTRQHVTVALSGDGGDELFAGYNRYIQGERFSNGLSKYPAPIKRLIKKIIYLLPPDKWSAVSNFLPKKHSIPQFGDKLYKLSDLLQTDSTRLYEQLVSHWQDPETLVINGYEPVNDSLIKDFASNSGSIIEKMQLLDSITYLPEDILTKVDRASMAVSLEVRAPLLDYRLVEFSWRLPMHMKVRHGRGKWVLRQLLYKYIPQELVERPKMGFGVPIADWLRGSLRDWAEELLDETKIKNQGYLNYAPIKQKWQEHLSGKRNWQYQLWNVLMFQEWHERWMS